MFIWFVLYITGVGTRVLVAWRLVDMCPCVPFVRVETFSKPKHANYIHIYRSRYMNMRYRIYLLLIWLYIHSHWYINAIIVTTSWPSIWMFQGTLIRRRITVICFYWTTSLMLFISNSLFVSIWYLYRKPYIQYYLYVLPICIFSVAFLCLACISYDIPSLPQLPFNKLSTYTPFSTKPYICMGRLYTYCTIIYTKYLHNILLNLTY